MTFCQGYSQYDYFGEIGNVVQQIAGDSAVSTKNNMLIVPGIQTQWTPESVWNTGLVSSFSSSIYGLAVERFVENQPSVSHSMVLIFPQIPD